MIRLHAPGPYCASVAKQDVSYFCSLQVYKEGVYNSLFVYITQYIVMAVVTAGLTQPFASV